MRNYIPQAAFKKCELLSSGLTADFYAKLVVTVGRKNWLFSATPKCSTASALVYTMVEMAKANELNICKYLTYLLEHRPSEDMSDEQLEELTPWSKEVQNVCKN